MSKSIYLPNSDIYINLRNRFAKKYDEVYTFIGYDTETFNGTCKLICDSKGNSLLDGTFYECLEFLIDDIDDNSHRIFLNMDFDLTAILKLYKGKKEKIQRLLDGFTETFKNLELTYLRPKFLSIKKGNKRVFFTDIYFMFRTSLNVASKKYLNDEKIDDINGKILNESLDYWNENLNKIIEYCIKDCVLTANLGVFLVNKMKEAREKAIQFNPKYEKFVMKIPKFITSHASFSRQFFMENCRIASIKHVPLQILDISVSTYFGGRFEIIERGFFKKLISLDINSAYPETISMLPSLKYGKWKYINSKKEVSKKEIIGYYKVHLIIPEMRISPFVIKHKGVVLFPSGVFETWITWYEYDLLKDYVYAFYDGFEYHPYPREYYPFKEAIDFLFSLKSFFKYDKKENDEVLSWIFKIFMNAVYGCFIERHKQILIDENGKETEMTIAGKMFNPIYASIITARTRWKLLKDSGKRNWKYIIGFHTDSIICKKLPLRMIFKLGKKLGKWSIEKKGKGLIIMSGIYQIGKYARNRGFSTKNQDSIKETSEGKSLDWYDVLRNAITKEKNCSECNNVKKCNKSHKIQFERMKVIKSAESMKRWNNLEKANSFIEFNKCLDINSDVKRNWNRDFYNISDLLENNISSKTRKMKYISYI